MGHDVYICYDEKDSEYADTICSIFEQNNIKTWIKSKDMSSNDSVDKITQAIENSKCFVLILSNHSKDNNYVLTEIDIAFSRNIPIISFNMDDLRLDGNLEWILENQTIIPLFPNAKKQLKTLVKETSEIIEKPLNKIKIGFKSIKKFEKINPGKKRYIIKKSIEIAIPIFIVLLLVFICIILPTGQNTTEDGVFSMNITDVDVIESGGNYKYTVFGESYNLPSDSYKYIMNIQFFDKNDNMVYEINSTADEFKVGVICTCNLDDDNVTYISFKLTDLSNNLLSNENYIIE